MDRFCLWNERVEETNKQITKEGGSIMRIKACVCLLMFSVLTTCILISQPAAAASAENEVMQVVTDFTKALNTPDYKLMSTLWWHSEKASSFEPSTGYPFLYQGWDAIGEWWKDLESSETATNVQTLHHPRVTMLSDDVAVTTVYCNNVYTDPETRAQSVSLMRQTMVVQKIKGKWLIVHHHCSGFPVE